MTKANLWDRQLGESDKAFQAFAIYRDLGVNRSIDSVTQKLNKSRTLISRWSGLYNWVERVSAYDDYTDAQARKKFEADTIKRKADMLKRHSLMGRVMQTKGAQYLEAQGIDKSSDAIAAISKGVDIERKSEGLPEYLMEIVNTDDNELARQYAELLASLSGAGSGDEEAGDTDPGTPAAASETPASS